MCSDLFRLSDIQLIPIKRYPTGIAHLDLCYGVTTFLDKKGRPESQVAGLPIGAVSLWSGSPGVGKSRVCIEIAGTMNAAGYRVLYIQNEVSPSQFRQWTSTIAIPNNFFVCTSNNLQEQINTVKKVAPHLVILDSINMIQGFNSPAVIRQVIERYKSVAVEKHCHAILIGHLNKAGTVKGNNDVEYLIDVQCDLLPAKEALTTEQYNGGISRGVDYNSMFYVKFVKNRYGSTNTNGHRNYVLFRHTPLGLVFEGSNFSNAIQEEDE